MNNKFHVTIFVVVLVSLFIYGCGQEPIGDMAARQQDILTAAQDFIGSQNQMINGTYKGSSASSDVFLTIEETRVTKDGTTVSQSTLAGAFVLSPKIGVSKNYRRVQFAFPFSDGTYDPHKGALSFTLEKDGRPSVVKCMADKQKNLSCKWNVRGKSTITLVPTSIKKLEALSRDNTTHDFSYMGKWNNYDLTVRFEGGVVTREGSKVAETAILGGIRFKSTVKPNVITYSFVDGTYDFPTDTVTLLLSSDDGSRVSLVCEILNDGSKLNCNYNSRIHGEFELSEAVDQ